MRWECRRIEKCPGSSEDCWREVGRDEESNLILSGILSVTVHAVSAKEHLRSNHKEADVGSWTPIHCVNLLVK
jgi:hypothetical protein